MKMRIIKDYTDEESKEIQEKIRDKHGSKDKLKQRVSRTGCRDPEMVDEYVILDSLEKGADYKYEEVTKSTEAISALTPRRIDILTHLYESQPGSISDLASELGRDYKNVYDDINALSEHGLITLEKEGKRRRPVLKADRLEIDFT